MGLCALALAVVVVGELVRSVIAYAGEAGHTKEIAVLAALFALCFALYVLWKFWRGEEWARLVVVAVAFVWAARELLAIGFGGLGVISAMSHPLSFLQAVLGVFLLYWLNTAELKRWFQHTPHTAIDHMSERLKGKICTAIEQASDGWRIRFEGDAELLLHCPWRIVVDNNLAFASEGYPPQEELPYNEQPPQLLLPNLRVTDLRAAATGNGLVLVLEMGVELETWKTAAGDLWRYTDPELTVTAEAESTRMQKLNQGTTEASN